MFELFIFFSNRDLCKTPNLVNSEDADNMNYNAMIDNVGFLFNKVLKVMLNFISGQWNFFFNIFRKFTLRDDYFGAVYYLLGLCTRS